MARLDPVPREQLRWTTRIWLWLIRRAFGRVLKPYPVLAHAPKLVGGMTLLNAFFSTGKWQLPAGIRTLVHLRVATLVGCVF